MTSTDAQLPAEPHDGIDPMNNADARAYEQDQSFAVARASDGGAPPTDAPPAGESPVLDGAAAGDPLAGLTVSEDESENAASGDLGPEHPGVRRSS